MAKERACKACKAVFEGSKCPNCESQEFVEGFKGKISILNPEQSEIAQKIGINKKGVFAVKLR